MIKSTRILTAMALACSFGGSAHAGIPSSERVVLRNFYESTNGVHWNNSVDGHRKWLVEGTDPCTWFGITCDSDRNHVIGVGMRRNNLVGSLPRDLSQLRYLEVIVLEGNQLSGSIPSLAGLTELVGLHLARNDLSGAIPSLSGLSSLWFVNVSHNQLSGPIPPSLSDLPDLQYLDVGHNRLSGRVPKAPASLTRFSTELCPNFLDLAPSADPAVDASWDVATGQTPWWGVFGSRCDILFREVDSTPQG